MPHTLGGLCYDKAMAELVGILNITPDSFSDGGEFLEPSKAIQRAKQLFAHGAAFIDIGAESTRPKAEPITSKQEWARLEEVLKVVLPMYPGKVSLDSHNPETIKKAFKIGPVIINDVTGMNDQAMRELVAELKPTCIVSHLPNMSIQEAHKLTPVFSVEQVRADLLEKDMVLQKLGLPKEQIILDPGIGFGKLAEVNRELLKFADLFPGRKIMIGYSRKRFLGDDRMNLEPNLQAGKVAIAHGATYLRVHDVQGHRQLVRGGQSKTLGSMMSINSK